MPAAKPRLNPSTAQRSQRWRIGSCCSRAIRSRFASSGEPTDIPSRAVLDGSWTTFRTLVYAFAFPEKNGDLVEINGLAEEITLHLIAAQALQRLRLGLVVDALGDDFD